MPSRISEDKLDRPEQMGKKGGALQGWPKVPKPTNKRNAFCSWCPRSVWHAKWGRCPLPRDDPGSKQHAHGVGRRGESERARGLTRPGGAARMLSPAPLRVGRETRHSGAGGGALAQPPLTRAGYAAAAALSTGAQPKPGLACAAAPRRRRRLLCSSGGSSSRHGQAQRGAHPRAARYEAAVVSGTPRLGASQTQCIPPRGIPQP